MSGINLDDAPLDGSSRRRTSEVVDAQYHKLRQDFIQHMEGCDHCPSVEEVFLIADEYVARGHGSENALELLDGRFCQIGTILVAAVGKLSWERGDSWRS
jgi:hypothetical protein